MPDRLLLTGGSSALGQAIAAKLGGRFDLVLLGRDGDTLQNLAESLPRPTAHQVIVGDLCHLGGLGDLLSDTIKRHGPLGTLIHAAGVSSPGPLRLQKPDVVERIFQVNTLSAIELCRLLGISFNRKALSRALFVSSISADRGCPGFTAYAAAKAGLESVCRTLAVENAGSTGYVTVALGPLATRTRSAPWALLDKVALDYALDPASVAQALAQILDMDWRLISGQTITLDATFSLKLAVGP